ncbi:methyltransferase type 11 [Rhodanobacter thiooxydans]|uniref:Methyltransferase type 11 n=1 Tax=Rhodanobacter thiooxydans TaxID=416169 RepID=A0A154QIE0_9GAMM|nr:class I SAM-dependent methyltransferase [Rhodanobacter thiooxydans]EIM01639.1 hypothetical protein UUA_03838 [Rhodanobacter thiooxydans LCS2]KZC23623.1 methyltransferase type 11 [Rhodanobacter thiooxydans]MCW0201712.1 class I SAM-dependent methyltransferase [Rhodanobacter thiooxydans]
MDRHGRQRIISLYGSRLQRGYARLKLGTDPVYAAATELVAGTALPLLDIGCGIGLLGLYLHVCGQPRRYLGLDHDRRKIATGQQAVRRAGLEALIDLHHADVAELPPTHGHVALLDVLHYLPAGRQPILLREAARHLAPDGCLIIRNVLREPHWRFHATRVEEFFLRTSGWIPGGAQHYPSADEVRAPLEDVGLEVRIEPLRGRTPFNSYLIVARPHR